MGINTNALPPLRLSRLKMTRKSVRKHDITVSYYLGVGEGSTWEGERGREGGQGGYISLHA